MSYDWSMWPSITRSWTLAIIYDEPDPYYNCLHLARFTNHELDRCCLHLVRSTYSCLYLPCLYLPCRFPLFSFELFPYHDRDGSASDNCFFVYLRCRQCFRSFNAILKCKKTYALLMRFTTGFWNHRTSFILHYIRFCY